jgi:hypothetical protein
MKVSVSAVIDVCKPAYMMRAPKIVREKDRIRDRPLL